MSDQDFPLPSVPDDSRLVVAVALKVINGKPNFLIKNALLISPDVFPMLPASIVNAYLAEMLSRKLITKNQVEEMEAKIVAGIGEAIATMVPIGIISDDSAEKLDKPETT